MGKGRPPPSGERRLIDTANLRGAVWVSSYEGDFEATSIENSGEWGDLAYGVSNLDMAETISSEDVQEMVENEEEDHKNKFPVWVFVIIGLVVLLIIGSIVICYMRLKKKDKALGFSNEKTGSNQASIIVEWLLVYQYWIC